jgi:hypothetical protein
MPTKGGIAMKKPSKSAGNLKELIQHAMQDLEITPKEYQQIVDLAQDDSVLDKEEKALMSQFHEMLSNGTITRVRG